MAQDGATGGAAHRPSLNFVRREPHDETCALPQPCSLTIRCLSCFAGGLLLVLACQMRRRGDVTIAGYDVESMGWHRLAPLTPASSLIKSKSGRLNSEAIHHEQAKAAEMQQEPVTWARLEPGACRLDRQGSDHPLGPDRSSQQTGSRLSVHTHRLDDLARASAAAAHPY